MLRWPRYPIIYEINTWVWLSDLREKFGPTIDLGSIPTTVWDDIAGFGFDAVWLMGVWERSPFGVSIANRNRNLVNEFRKALPDFTPSDTVGSPYCVRNYIVDERLGGPNGLAVARNELAARGIHLILDFVPNHVAPDHPWVVGHPEYFISASSNDAYQDPSSYIKAGRNIFACGRDPYFPAWPDVLQLNAFESCVRDAVTETLDDIANQCDGVRCDMAMLMLNETFEYTWGSLAGPRPSSDYWIDVIPRVKEKHPSLIFIAEAYWDREWDLQKQGFDFCYDKRLYDRLRQDNANSIRLHLGASLNYQEKLLRFIENHDEARAAAVFDPAKERLAAVTFATLPGAKLFYEGQFEGRKTKLPVFLGRRPHEPVDEGLRFFYKQLLSDISTLRDGDWALCECEGWPDNQSCQNVLAWTWQQYDQRHLTVVNFSANRAQSRVQVRLPSLQGQTWHLVDILSDASYDRAGDEMLSPGLYIDLSPWGYNCFLISPTARPQPVRQARQESVPLAA
jgi:hypothetical protein